MQSTVCYCNSVSREVRILTLPEYLMIYTIHINNHKALLNILSLSFLKLKINSFYFFYQPTKKCLYTSLVYNVYYHLIIFYYNKDRFVSKVIFYRDYRAIISGSYSQFWCFWQKFYAALLILIYCVCVFNQVINNQVIIKILI